MAKKQTKPKPKAKPKAPKKRVPKGRIDEFDEEREDVPYRITEDDLKWLL